MHLSTLLLKSGEQVDKPTISSKSAFSYSIPYSFLACTIMATATEYGSIPTNKAVFCKYLSERDPI